MTQASKIRPPRNAAIFRNPTVLTLWRYLQWVLREASFLGFLLVALYLLISLLTFNPQDAAWAHTGPAKVSNWGGYTGAWFADISLHFLGYLAYLLPVSVAYCGWQLFKRGALAELDFETVMFRIMGFVIALAAGCGLASLHLRGVPAVGSGGGFTGDIVGPGLIGTFASLGGHSYLIGNLFMAVLFLAAITLATGRSWLDLLELLGQVVSLPLSLFENLAGTKNSANSTEPTTATATAPVTVISSVKQSRESAQAPVNPVEKAIAEAPPLPLVDKQTECNETVMLTPPREAELAEEPVKKQSERNEPIILPPSREPRSAEEKPSLALVKELPQPSLREETPVAPESLVASVASRASAGANPRSVRLEPVITLHSSQPDRPTVHTEPPMLRVVRTGTTTPLSPLPPLPLLDPAPAQQDGYSDDDLESMSRQVEILLRHFGIEVQVVAVEPGPVITCFELEPAPGVKVSQISNLAKDLARGLSVTSVRVVEVIPGKSVIGLEIPNKRRQIVYLSEILTAPVYTNSTAPMTVALGKDIGGKPIVANLAKMPHLLVAGTTGSGKSVAINAMLLSMLYKATPREVRLILVDPKMLELSVYEEIPHLLAPVVTDMKEAANALRWCVGAMERRYRLMAPLKVRNLAGFNQKVQEANDAGEPIADPLFKPEEHFETEVPTLEPMPNIVVVIDELADMMMVVGKKVEELIARLAQKARAAGIHLILATQRPSVDVITGLIKANIPTRIAFQVSSKVDSRTILDQMGAEQLLGHGDMLYLPPGTGFTRRVHGAFVSDHEVLRVVEYLRQTGEPDYIEDILQEPGEVIPGLPGMEGDYGSGGDEADPLYDQAVRIVTESRRASISGVQRRLKIG
ncbi:MAG TPA: DNA translocase FtsK 4TM domain-containing protein, partial [Candidatus Competibacteraceae bacterium]|nr:DNA translocase FtsK 4TM domain-containing protein [Candidatus Competibacteraceae bacterium]